MAIPVVSLVDQTTTTPSSRRCQTNLKTIPLTPLTEPFVIYGTIEKIGVPITLLLLNRSTKCMMQCVASSPLTRANGHLVKLGVTLRIPLSLLANLFAYLLRGRM